MGADGILLAAFAFFAALVLALLIALVLQNRRIRLAAGLLVCAWALWQLALLWRNHFPA